MCPLRLPHSVQKQVYRGPQENHEKLLHEADGRLYDAKRQGKNRVVG